MDPAAEVGHVDKGTTEGAAQLGVCWRGHRGGRGQQVSTLTRKSCTTQPRTGDVDESAETDAAEDGM